METWKSIDTWPGYEVSNHGRVRSWKVCRRSPQEPLPRILAAWVLPNGYAVVKLKDRGRRANVYLHHAVAAAFIGQRPQGMEVAHGDGDKANNSAENLRYATPLANAKDRVRHGTGYAGSRHHSTSLDEEAVAGLRAFVGTHAEAARAAGVTYHIAYRIRTGRVWRRA